MGAFDNIKKSLGGNSKEKMKCEQDPQTGLVRCELNREMEDGTSTNLASFDLQFNEQCQGIPINMQENEPGALDRLEKKAYKRIREKCIGKKPSDY